MLGFQPISTDPISALPVAASTDIVPMIVMIGPTFITCFGIGTCYTVSPNNGLIT